MSCLVDSNYLLCRFCDSRNRFSDDWKRKSWLRVKKEGQMGLMFGYSQGEHASDYIKCVYSLCHICISYM